MAFLSFDDGGSGVTNLLTYSEQFDNAAWSKTNVSASANLTTSPDGTTDADALTASAATAVLCVQDATAPSGTVTYSLFIKKGNGGTVANTYGLYNLTTAADLRFVSVNFDTGTTTDVVGTGGVVLTKYGNGWYRLAITVASGITAGDSLRCYAAFTGNAVSIGDFSYVWGAQFQAGGYATAYIPTTSATASAACVACDYPDTPASRFTNWTPSTKPVGDSVNTLASGAVVMFRHRTDYGASFDLVGIPVKAQADGVNYVAIADRLIAHLMSGGTCLVQTDDSNAAIYKTCGLAPGSSPSLRMTDSRNLLYTLSLQLINLAASPVRMDAVYAP